MIGKTLKGHYRILENLTRGAFGKTYLAERTQQDTRGEATSEGRGSESELPDRCVVQSFQPPSDHPLIGEEARKRFENEISVLTKLGEHSQIPSILDYFQENREFYVFEEFIDGQNLEREMTAGKRWSPLEVMGLLNDVLEVLEFVHQHGVIHRNIKPSNLIRRRSDRKIAVVDFGKIKEIETLVLSPSGETSTAAIGTSGYVPLEQLNGKPSTGSDIYALGIVAIEALTGVSRRDLKRDPKTGQVIWHELVDRRQGSFGYDDIGQSNLYSLDGNPLEAILDKMVCADDSKRYQSATEVLGELRGLHKIGQVLDGRYKIISVLGEGEFGTTFLATDEQRAGNPKCAIERIKTHGKKESWPGHGLEIAGNLIAKENSAYSAEFRWENFENFTSRSDRIGRDDSWEGLEYEGQIGAELARDYRSENGSNGSNGYRREEEGIEPIFPLVDARNLFDWEAQVLHHLGGHDRIPRLLDDFEENDEFYLVREYIEGQSLKVEMISRPKWSEAEAIAFLEDVLETLAFIHEQNVTHRALSPANLIRRESDSKIEVIDFGSAKQISTLMYDESGQLTSSCIVGSQGYMPKEQLQENARQNSDIYALGAIAIQGVTGIHPSQLGTDAETGEMGWRENAPQIGDNLAAILDKMVLTYFRERYQSASEILDDLPPLPAPPEIPVEELKIQEAPPEAETPEQEAADKKVADKKVADKKVADKKISPAALPLSIWNEWRGKKSFKLWYALVAVGTMVVAISLYGAYKSKQQAREANRLTNQGNALLASEEAEEAKAVCDRAIAIKEKDSQAWKCYGDALYQLGDYREARVSYQKASQLDPNNPKIRDRSGEALYKLGLYQEALKEFQKANELDPTDAKIWENTGLTLEALKKPEQARQTYEQALAAVEEKLQANPQYPTAWVERGRILQEKLERPEEALAAYNKALQLVPDLYIAWNAKGSVLYELELFEESLNAYNRALDINPEYAPSWHGRGVLLNKAFFEPEEAIASYDKAIAIAPRFFPAWRDRGITLSDLSRYSEALESFEKALDIQQRDRETWVKKGLTLIELRRDKEALEAFERATEIEPDYADAWMQRGVVLEYLEREREALDSYNKALEIEPDFEKAIAARSLLEKSLGR
ncbi:MAG: tetratricopeptide repeat protein [Oscillatoria sp. SIO1A7]|nr:tetratricopeptide repeat protein [Oscillatoria sp. SIO1A7]